jgi:hypothetical protein
MTSPGPPHLGGIPTGAFLQFRLPAVKAGEAAEGKP